VRSVTSHNGALISDRLVAIFITSCAFVTAVTSSCDSNHCAPGNYGLKSCLVEKVSHQTSAAVSTSPASKHALETIPRNRVYSQVAEQLETRIVNELKPGDMLPPERELVKRFGVSRSSIRDAIRSLEARGLLEPRQGVGTVVRAISPDALMTPVTRVLLRKQKTIRELLDIRHIIEPGLAQRAALHRSPEQLAELREILRRQEEKISHGELATDEDTAFHYTLALAADNATMMKLVRVLMDLLRGTRERSLQGEGRARKSLAGHLRIFAAVQRGDAAAAADAMHRHLSEIEETVLQKL
jgi:GntR family transcriptional repressor for pyruvate dehydrogenase complex